MAQSTGPGLWVQTRPLPLLFLLSSLWACHSTPLSSVSPSVKWEHVLLKSVLGLKDPNQYLARCKHSALGTIEGCMASTQWLSHPASLGRWLRVPTPCQRTRAPVLTLR